MSQDHYAILGVAPTAPPAVVRAAYLALMREYHPDRNASAAAVQRAQAIGAAYKVLGDFDRRQEYDFGRRRARDAAAAAARPKPKGSAVIVIAAAFGLAVAGAIALQPGAGPSLPPDRLPDIAIAEPASTPRSVPVVAKAPTQTRAPTVKRNAAKRTVDFIAAKLIEPPKPDSAPAARLAAAEPAKAKPRVKPVQTAARPVPKLAMVVVTPLNRAATSTATDLASLDQFVMSFYGQSWRYGDGRKRAALEQSRSGFLVRRGACSTDACKRAAYLKLQRDVSAIVESGQPAR